MHSGKRGRSDLWLNAMHSAKKWWIREFVHPRRPRGGQSGREKRRDKSFQPQAEKFRPCLKTFVAPFNPARLTAPGSPRMEFVPPYIFPLNPDYVAAPSPRPLRSNWLKKHGYILGIFQSKIDCIWNNMRQEGHLVKRIQQYSLGSVRQKGFAIFSLHLKVSAVTKKLKITFLL